LAAVRQQSDDLMTLPDWSSIAQLRDFLLTLQLLLWEMSESMGNHDSEVVDASSVD